MFTKTLYPDTVRAIQLVSKIPEVKEAYLAGGTALALQLGHRMSIDLDFFTQHEFDEKLLSTQLASYPKFIEDGTAQWTVWGRIGETKFSIFYYNYPPLAETVEFEGLHLASLQDIAAMKIHALESRGTKRDFVDVYMLAKTYTLDQMLTFYQQKYATLDDHLYNILRSLEYFEDAEQEHHMPEMLIPLEWEDVKSFFQKETKLLAEKMVR